MAELVVDVDAGTSALLQLRGVTRRYPNGTVALRDVSLTLRPGERVAIVGRSGSGKSTLLNILGLLDVPDSGELFIEDRVVERSDRSRSERRAVDLGFIFQRSHLIPALTVRDNVLLGLRYADVPDSDIGSAAAAALKAVGLASKIDALARTLSGGEMQRVAIARTLARPAKLWLADEPTGNLDSTQSVEVIELLRARALDRGAALVVVTHEPDIAARMDRIVTLQDGRIIGDEVNRASRRSTAPLPPSSAPPASGRGFSHLRRVKRNVRFIAQGVAAHPARARSGVVAACLAVSLTVAALGLAQSAAAQVTGLFDAQRATQVTARLASDSDGEPRWPIRIDAVRSYTGVTGAEYWRHRTGVAITNGDVSTQTIDVVEVDSAPGAATDSVVDWAPRVEHRLADGEVILGNVLARRLGVAQLDASPEVTLNGRRLLVVGTLTSSRPGAATGSAFVTAASTAGLAASLSAELYIETAPGAARDVADRIQPLADPFQTTRMTIDPVLEADSYRGELQASVSVALQVLAVVASLAGLAAVVFVNILSVSSRTAEFGVRRAFGARRREIVVLVVGECTLLGALGAALGLALGFAAVMAVSAVARWQPVFDPRLLAVPLIGALMFGTLGSLPPAVAAGRIEPADAVRS